MAKFYVTTHSMQPEERIGEPHTLSLYCSNEGQRDGWVKEVLEACPRVEHYIKKPDGETVGVFFLMYTLDMHHGYVAMLAAHWTHELYRGNRDINQLTLMYIREFCREYGCSKYQRSKHLSPTVQIQFTKEV